MARSTMATIKHPAKPAVASENGKATPKAAGEGVRKIATVSHTLDSVVAERLRQFAFRERISESAVIEFSLRAFFDSGDDARLGQRLRDAGAALRRRT